MRAFDPQGTDPAKQIDKAVGHVYRATFDALDGSAISLRQKIEGIVQPYPHHVRLACIADYAKTAHELNEMTGKISQLRAEKDIGKDLSAAVQSYITLLARLKEIHDDINERAFIMDKYHAEAARSGKKQTVIAVLGIFLSVLGLVLTLWPLLK